MSRHKHLKRKPASSVTTEKPAGSKPLASSALLPLGAMLLAGSMNTSAQQTTPDSARTLATVEVSERAETPQAKTSLRSTKTSIGKGTQKLRDIPQSITVVTEHLMDDRNYDDFKEVLRSTGGVTFLSGETGEEDIRLRGFSLSQAGDIYVDGMRDSMIYERDTFNYDRVEVIKGSASMLFGRGSTGGVVNQVNKKPYLMTAHEVKTTIGSGNELRVTGDFNLKTDDDAALRLNVMTHEADNYGAKISKRGIAPSYRWGIGTRDEFQVSLYQLSYNNRAAYGLPWVSSGGEIQPVLDSKNYYGLTSDYNRGSATYGTLSHTRRFDDGAELKTSLRHGLYYRDLWASALRFTTTPASASAVNDSTSITRGQKGRIAYSTITNLQSDYSDTFKWWGLKHQIITGVDLSNENALRNNNYPGGNASGAALTTLVGTPNDGEFRTDPRGDAPMDKFNARNIGVYVQDVVELSPTLKLVGGLRNDNFTASYNTAAGASNNRADSLWSPRLGALYQPNDWSSYYTSYGTSYNVSGDAYQYSVGSPTARVANTPAEQSRNIEFGGKFDLLDKKLMLTTSLFYSEKYNERNTDPDTAATQELLSGKRHAAGVDLNAAGRITPAWEAFFSWTWIPNAEIDEAVATTNANTPAAGDRPGLTPVHSGSFWNTYKINSQFRLGAGLNYRGRQTPLTNKNLNAKEFTTLDLMAEYSVNALTSIRLNINNVTNERYADGLYSSFYTPGAPLSAQLTLKVLFE